MNVQIVLPVFNEEAQLESSVHRVAGFLSNRNEFDLEIVIADNGSTDSTPKIGERLAREQRCVRAVRLTEKGRGRALKQVWLESQAEVLSYMDVDLSTDLASFAQLITAIAKGGFDLAIGSRLLPASQVTRCWKRELISRGYNRLIKLMFRTRFSDAQCGFKAIRLKAAQELLPLVEDTGWFFDTELLVLAERLGYRICDVPVRWIEDSDSRVKIVRTAWADLKGLVRLRRALAQGKFQARQAARPQAASPARE